MTNQIDANQRREASIRTGVSSLEESIISAIKGKELMIEEVAAAVKINRITASKYLAVLEAKGLVKYRPIGKAKLFSEVMK